MLFYYHKSKMNFVLAEIIDIKFVYLFIFKLITKYWNMLYLDVYGTPPYILYGAVFGIVR